MERNAVMSARSAEKEPLASAATDAKAQEKADETAESKDAALLADTAQETHHEAVLTAPNSKTAGQAVESATVNQGGRPQAAAFPSAAADTAEGTAEEAEQSGKKTRSKVYFTASRIAKIALLSALAYVVTFLEFPIFPAASFLKLDFANVFVLLGGFMYGPIAAIVISGVKELLSLLDTSTAGIGEIANFLLTFSFVIVPVTVYRLKKGLKTVIFTLAIGCVLLIAAGLITNRYINFPLYEQFLGMNAKDAFALLWEYIAVFNLIKGVVISLLTVLLYKRISWLFKKF